MPEKSVFELSGVVLGAIAGMMAMIQGLGALIIKRWRRDHDVLTNRVDHHDTQLSTVATIDDFHRLEKTISTFHTSFAEQAEERTERLRGEIEKTRDETRIAIKHVYTRMERGEDELRKSLQTTRDIAIANKAQMT